MLDYDNDGWLDLFFVNGTTLEGFPRGKEPTSHLYRNRGNGTFEDVTARAGLAIAGWGQGACAGDYDNDGFDDLYVTLLGPEPPVPQSRQRDVRGRHRPRRAGHQNALGRRLRILRCRPRRPARSVRRQLHRLRSEDRAGARVGALPVQGHSGCLRSARADRRKECVVPEYRPRHLRRRFRGGRHHASVGHLRPRRQHARLRRRWVDRCLRRERLEPEHAVSQPSRRHVRGYRGSRGLRLQPGRETAGRHGPRDRRLRPQRHDPTSSRPTSRATRRRCTRTPATGSARIARLRAASASTRDGSGGASDSSTSISTAGSICFS